MPRKKTNGLPPNVNRGKSAYELRQYLGKGLPRKYIRLCGLDAPISEVWRLYESHKKESIKNISWLFREYTESAAFKKKAQSTRDYQLGQIERMNEYLMKSGKPFGSAELRYVTSGSLRQYLDKREADGAPKSGNREVSLISVAWNWCLERDLIAHPNPCANVTKNEEVPRTRYVTDTEYEIAYTLAAKYPYLQPAMELAYLCRMRRIEVLKSTKAQILKEGFDTLRMKGSNDAITEWSERLSAAVNYRVDGIDSFYIIHDKKGQAITFEAFKTAWTRLKRLMKKANIEPFNYHDLKAKGVSDFEGDQLKASGHKDPKMLKVYDRKKHTVKATK